ncbi:MAG TPA: DHA2 family efflux MFS transporter permease subunit [Phycisphaerales bacterium]|nr:DHA2 family efflux MFS transporter permease subunit [Phycisphaerales bacterium]HMP36367.1 DHA2 family efflux MFS transporter permease subunit [Phycisphaerales bacterium]
MSAGEREAGAAQTSAGPRAPEDPRAAGSAPEDDELAPLPPGMRRALVTFTTLLVSVMATIDATIVAICMPQMQGSLDASPTTIVWVMTMFNIGQAIGIALTGKLAMGFGRRRVMLIAIAGFVLLSCLCGIATSLDEMVIGRFLQGLFAAPLIPLSQATIVDAYPAAERQRGLAIWTMGVVVGPAIGPALGGVLTEHLSWRMAFFVNVPIGAAALLLTWIFVRRTPRVPVRLDAIGIALVALLVIPLQVALDQGDTLDWFSSRTVIILLGVAAIAGAAFIARSAGRPGSILRLELFRDRAFALCTANITLLGLVLFGLYTLHPTMMETLLGWQVDTAGLAMGVMGSTGFLGALLAPRISAIIGPRSTVVLGAAIAAIGLQLGTGLNLDVGRWQAVMPGTVAMLGIVLAYVPTTALAFARVPPDQRDDAVAQYNFVKTIGMAIGVTLIATLLYRRPEFHWNALGGGITANAPGLEPWIDQLGEGRWTPLVAEVVAAELLRQATMLAIVEIFRALSLVSLAVAVIALAVPRAKASAPSAAAAE